MGNLVSYAEEVVASLRSHGADASGARTATKIHALAMRIWALLPNVKMD